MARPQVREVSQPSAIQGMASPVSTYVRPADPAPSSLHQLAQGLAAFDSGLGKFLEKRKQEKDAADYQRGLAESYREQGPAWEEGVRQGRIPPQDSPRFMEGLRTGQGNLTGMRLRSQFRQEFLQWEGREKGDPAAFGSFLTDFITKNVPEDSDPDFLKGLNPHINTLFEEGYEGFTKDTSTAVYNEGLRTDTAALTEVIRTHEEDGQATSGIDYEAVWTQTLAIREEALKRGTLHADIDGHLVETIIQNAERTKDEGLLSILDKTLPGQDHPMSYGLEVQKKRDAAAERITNAKAKDEADNAKAREEAEKELAGRAYAEIATIWSRNIQEEIPEEVIEDLSRIDPMARSKLADLRKKMADADGIEDKATIAGIFADIHQGTATKQDIMAHFERGTIRSTETLNQALDRVERMDKERKDGTGILSDATLRKWHTLIEGLTGSDPVNPFAAAGLSDEGLEAIHDMNIMVLDWEAKNPEASFIERQEAINRIGGIIRQRIELQDGQTTGGLYLSEAEKAAREEEASLAEEAPIPEAIETPAPVAQESAITEFLSEAARRVNPLTGVAEGAIEWLFGSSEPVDVPAPIAPDVQSAAEAQDVPAMPVLESLPEDQRQAVTDFAERHGVDTETAQRDIWNKVQELISKEEAEVAPDIDPTTTDAIPEDIKGDLSSLFENPPALEDAPLATAYVNPKSNPNVASQVLEKFAGRTLPVSIRNNNMGAVSITGDIDSSWAAKQPGFVGTTKRPKAEGGYYAKFATPEHGVAAASKLLEQFGRKGINTPEAIVTKWSTDTNAHATYARTLAKHLNAAGIEAGVDTPLDLSDPKVRIAVLKAKSAHESGAGVPIYAEAVFERGANYQLGEKRRRSRGLAVLAPNGLKTSSKRGYQPDIENLKPELKAGVESLQKAWGRDLPIVSGFRDAARNKKAGGAKGSQHQHGNAVDIDVSDLSQEDRIKLIKTASEQGFKGIGVYANSLHLDYGTKRYWGPSHGKASLPAWAKAAIEEHMSREA